MADLHWDELHRCFPGSEKYLGKEVVDKEDQIPRDQADKYITRAQDYMYRAKVHMAYLKRS